MTKATVKTKLYHAELQLDESGVWIAQLEEIPQVHTFGRTLGKAREYLVDALALWLNVSASSLKGRVVFRPIGLPNLIQESVDQAQAARVLSEQASIVASDVMTTAALSLTSQARLSYRDAAELLGVSHQRVQQLVTQGSELTDALGSGSQGIAQDIAQSLKEYLPGGSKDDLGALAAGVALGLALMWAQSRE